MVVCVYNPSTQKVEAGEIQGHSLQQKTFKASLGYVRPGLTRKGGAREMA